MSREKPQILNNKRIYYNQYKTTAISLYNKDYTLLQAKIENTLFVSPCLECYVQLGTLCITKKIRATCC